MIGGGFPRSKGSEEGGWDATSAERCQIWGVLNVTPDSFSDGGRFRDLEAALAQGRRLWAEGADVLDVGGESSRPAGKTYGSGAERVSVAEERDRVVPVVQGLVRELGARVSVDTVKAEVARAALEAGAHIVNDVSGGRSDALLRAVAECDAELVLMHNRGRGEVQGENIAYGDVVADVIAELRDQVDRATSLGVRPERIWIDPGVGFAKTTAQSAELLARTEELVATGHRVLIGASRKSLLAELAPNADGSRPGPLERVGGTATTVAAAVFGGAHAVRVHDVAMMRQAARVAEALRDARGGRA